MALKTDVLIVAGVGLALVAVAWYAKTQAGKAADAISQTVGDAWADVKSGAAVEAAYGAFDNSVKAGVTGISKSIGLTTPDETITDPQVCKFYMDENGVFAASTHCSAPAFLKALAM